MWRSRSPVFVLLIAVATVMAACSQGSVATTAPTTQGAVATASPGTASTTQPTSAAQPTMALMAVGTFHNVDGVASGEAQLIVTPTGAYEVVLESFKIASIEHINLVLVANADVTKSSDVDPSKLLDLGPLKAIEGMQDFVIPADMAGSVMEGYHTVVVWDTEMTHAIAAAPLK
jgi:hypothetical protein